MQSNAALDPGAGSVIDARGHLICSGAWAGSRPTRAHDGHEVRDVSSPATTRSTRDTQVLWQSLREALPDDEVRNARLNYTIRHLLYSLHIAPKEVAELLPKCISFRLQRVTYEESMEDELLQAPECVVCLQEFQEGDQLRRWSRCGHFFHKDCTHGWIDWSVKCPICREPLQVNINWSEVDKLFMSRIDELIGQRARAEAAPPTNPPSTRRPFHHRPRIVNRSLRVVRHCDVEELSGSLGANLA